MSFTKVKNNNLYDPDLVTLAEKGVGTGADQIVQLNTSAELPAVSGANLTNLPPSNIGDLVSTNNLSDLTNTTTARSNLGLVIGTNVQAFDATIVVDADIGVNVQAYDTDTSKIDVAETRTANIDLLTYSETKIAMSANSVNLSLGNVHTKTISGATTLTFDNPPATGKTGSFTLVLINGGTNVTFPTVKWDGGDVPSLSASGTDILSFMTMDGGATWYGFISGLGMA